MTTFTRITEDINPIVAPSHAGASGYNMSQVQTARPLDPRSSLEDYNRVMLAYTQRRMSTFVDMDNANGRGSPSSRSSRGSNSSGESGKSNSGILSRQGDVTSTPSSAAASAPQSHRGSEAEQMAEQAQ